MSEMHYLTVQDMLWINLQVTGSPETFRFDDLEEATFYQYGYGGSRDVGSQADRFLNGFLKKAPFASGNLLTGFVGYCAFLEMNGFRLDMTGDEARQALQAFSSHGEKGPIQLGSQVVPGPSGAHEGIPDVREIVGEVLDRFAGVVAHGTQSPAA